MLHGTAPDGEPAALALSYDEWSVRLLPHRDSWQVVGWTVGISRGPGSAIEDPQWEGHLT